MCDTMPPNGQYPSVKGHNMPVKIGNLTAYSVDDVAEMFGLKPPTIRSWFTSGRLTGRKVGKRWYALEEDLEAFVKKGTGPTKPAGGSRTKRAKRQGK